MDTEQSRVIVTIGGTASTACVHHRDFPEIRAEGESPKEAASHLVNQLTRALDSRPDRLAARPRQRGDRRRRGVHRRRSPDPRRASSTDASHRPGAVAAMPPPMTAETTIAADGTDGPGARAGHDRRHDDRHGVDDRLGHLHHLGRVGAAGRRTRLAAGGLGPAGLMTITGASAAAELAAMMPRAGGQYVFLREAYGPLFGFLFGWAMFLVVQTGTIAAVAVAFAKFLGVFWPADRRRRLPRRADRAGRLRAQPLDPAARRRRPDRVADGHEHAGPEARASGSRTRSPSPRRPRCSA